MGNCCQKDKIDEEFIKATLSMHVTDIPVNLVKGQKGKYTAVNKASSEQTNKAMPLKIFDTHSSPKNVKVRTSKKLNEAVKEEKTQSAIIKPQQIIIKAASCIEIEEAKAVSKPLSSGYVRDDYLHVNNYDNDSSFSRSCTLNQKSKLCIDGLQLPTIRLDIEADIFRCENKGKWEEKYEKVCFIDRGGYGEVNKIRSKTTGAIRALKSISKSKCQMTDDYADEIKILKILVTNIISIN